MVSREQLQLARKLAYRQYISNGGAIPQWPLAILLTSFFYCLPLGRFSLGGFASDFRIFDFAIVFVFGYYASIDLVTSEVSRLLKSKRWFLRWLKYLFVLVLFSLVVATLYSGTDFLLPRLIRIFRFLAYLSVPFLVFAVVRTKRQFIRGIYLLFGLIATMGVIGFLQGLGLLPNFWPDYWRELYSENEAPVATLSPHHKHMGVIMLVGVCLGIYLFQRTRFFLTRVIIVILILMMFTVPLFAGTRTYLLGFVGVIPAMIYMGRLNLVIPMLVVVSSAFVFTQVSGDEITSRVERRFDQRVTSRVEKLGYEGLYRERTIIYWDILQALIEHPYLLVTGTGFQNIFQFIRANGAHNNYLQALMEQGIIGFVVFIFFLSRLWDNLIKAAQIGDLEIAGMAKYTWAAFCGLLMTMFVGETFWGQAAMFTLAGQLAFLFGLAVSPLYWLNRYYFQGLAEAKS